MVQVTGDILVNGQHREAASFLAHSTYVPQVNWQGSSAGGAGPVGRRGCPATMRLRKCQAQHCKSTPCAEPPPPPHTHTCAHPAEPTTGLDSFAALSVMQFLKQLGNRGHTLVAAVHQPRGAIWQMFDQARGKLGSTCRSPRAMSAGLEEGDRKRGPRASACRQRHGVVLWQEALVHLRWHPTGTSPRSPRPLPCRSPCSARGD